MYARAARGQQSPQDSVAQAEAQMKPIFENWRKKRLIGGAA
jgi:multiple sugar transport system substrate-binding protein